jgi:transglutaminase-like putative cysteine protease
VGGVFQDKGRGPAAIIEGVELEPFRPYLALAVLSSAAILTLGRDFSEEAWLPSTLGAAWAALFVLWLLRRSRLTAPLRIPVAAIAGAWFLNLAIVPEAAFYGLPNPARLFELGLQAWEQTFSTPAPVAPEAGFRLLAATAVWVAILISEPALVADRPILTATPWIGMFTFTSATGLPEGRNGAVLIFTVGLLAFLYLAKAHSFDQGGKLGLARTRSDRATVASTASVIGGVATVAALIAPSFIAGYSPVIEWEGFGPASPTRISPIVQIRPRLRASPTIPLFDVRASAEGRAGPTSYWRLLSLDRFSGEVWYSSTRRQVPGLIAAPDEVPAQGFELHQRFHIRRLEGPWLPAAVQPVSVRGVKASGDPRSLSITVSRGLESGLLYEVVSVVTSPTANQLKQAPETQGLRSYRELTGVSDEVRRIASDLTKGKTTSYEKVLAISDHLRGFRYDESVESGHSGDHLLRFLTEIQAGYCEQFAAAMAVMVRAVGLPARVAVGFLPGDYDPGAGVFHVTSDHAHAWTEVYFTGVGWVPFEPTPRSGVSPAAYAVAPAVGGLGPEEATEDAGSPAASENAGQDPFPEETSEPATSPDRPLTPTSILLIASGAILLLLLLIPAAKAIRRAVRYRRAASAAERVWASFLEFQDLAADFRAPRAQSETPLEFVEKIRRNFDLESSFTLGLLDVFQRTVYGPGAPADSDAAIARRAATSIRNQLWNDSNLTGKIGLLASPRSLVMRSSTGE